MKMIRAAVMLGPEKMEIQDFPYPKVTEIYET